MSCSRSSDGVSYRKAGFFSLGISEAGILLLNLQSVHVILVWQGIEK